MFRHLSTNMENIAEAISRFNKETGIDLKGFEVMIYDLRDLSTVEDSILELEEILMFGREVKKFAVVRFTSLEDILSYDNDLYNCIIWNAHKIEV